MPTKEDVVRDLLGSSTVKRRKAAKAARTIGGQLCSELVQALELEEGSKHWQTRAELAQSLGVLRCKTAEPVLRKIVFSSSETDFDFVKTAASKALVRIAHSEPPDIQIVWEIANSGGYSAIEGALLAIGYDRMKFDDETCRQLVERFWDFGIDRPRGYTDPRYGLAAACAGWNGEICHDFLTHCLASNDTPLCYVSENSLKGKYVELR